MTRIELLKLLVGQARVNGFELRRWYVTRLELPWEGAEAALKTLDGHRRYYALLFSQEFARSFWKPGAEITFQVPAQSFERAMPDGSVATVQRKPFMRRSVRPEAWKYHLREMALAEEPLRYMRRYLNVTDDTDDDGNPLPPEPAKPSPATLALARKLHERRQLALNAKPITTPSKRGARVPGGRPKST